MIFTQIGVFVIVRLFGAAEVAINAGIDAVWFVHQTILLVEFVIRNNHLNIQFLLLSLSLQDR